MPAAQSYRVVGYLGGEFGLSISAQNTIQVLTATGRSVQRIPVNTGRTPGAGASPRPDSRSVNLFHLNAVDVAYTMPQWKPAIDPAGWHACAPFWELPLIPRPWVPVLQAMDVVLAPSRFIESACRRVLPRERVLHYPQAVFVPDGVVPARAAWGLDERATVCIVSFDIGSGLTRKNPFAGIEAFQRAFPSDADVQLVIKMKPWPHVRELNDWGAKLRARVGTDPRVRVVDRALSYPEVLGLYASADILVSLHRSEGLGLPLMEAMALGKSVVATHFSGNVDFMTEENSWPIGYRLVPVADLGPHAHPDYLGEVGRAGQVWAEPDLGAAAEALRALHASPTRRLELGRRAAADMARARADMLAGETFDRLEATLRDATGGRRLDAAMHLAKLYARWRRVETLGRQIIFSAIRPG
jgi:glycosyltransferase involved in cell wall biosynthesis